MSQDADLLNLIIRVDADFDAIAVKILIGVSWWNERVFELATFKN